MTLKCTDPDPEINLIEMRKNYLQNKKITSI